MQDERPNDRPVAPRRRLFGALVLGGFGLVALGWRAQGYLQALLLEVGSAVLLVAPLVILEKRLVRKIEVQVEDSIAESQTLPSPSDPFVDLVRKTVASCAASLNLQIEEVGPEGPATLLWRIHGGDGSLFAAILKSDAVRNHVPPVTAGELVQLSGFGVRLVLANTRFTKQARYSFPEMRRVTLTYSDMRVSDAAVKELAKELRELGREPGSGS